MTEEKSKSNGPSVYSKKNIADQFVGFEIIVGEVKNLPANYQSSQVLFQFVP